jgi:predicted HTH domain antitoxin
MAQETREQEVLQVLRQYKEEERSMRWACDQLGISLLELGSLLKKYNVPINYDLDDLEHDIAVVRKHSKN